MPETVGVFLLEAAGIADIAGIGAFTVGSATFAGVSLSAIVGTAAISAASIGVSIGLQYALRPALPKPEDGAQPLKQAIPPRIRGYGANRLAGYYMLFEAAGPAPATSYNVLAFHSGRIGSIAAIYLNDDVVNTTPDVNSGSQVTVYGGFVDGRYGSGAIKLEARLGAASQATLAGFVSDPIINTTWTAQFLGNGIAYIGMKCSSPTDVPTFTKIYPHQLPQLSLVAFCSPIWDPRDPAQHQNDQSTWVVSFNPVIQLIDYLTRVDGGMGLSYATMIAPNLTQWMAEADLCDELVDNGSGGTQRRYESSGWFQFDNKPEDVIGGILSTCDGHLSESGDGTLSLTVGVYRVPSDPPLTQTHIFGFALNYGQADEQIVNQLNINFTDPGSKYVSVQAPPWADDASIALTGVVRSQALDLKWVQNQSQARRLAARAMLRVNPLLSGSFTTSLYGLRYLGKRWIPIQYPFVSGLQNSIVEIQNAEVDLLAGRIVWDFILVQPAKIDAYNPVTDGGVPVVIPPPVPRRLGIDFSVAGNSQYLALLEDI